jgi:hypothetical protein
MIPKGTRVLHVKEKDARVQDPYVWKKEDKSKRTKIAGDGARNDRKDKADVGMKEPKLREGRG